MKSSHSNQQMQGASSAGSLLVLSNSLTMNSNSVVPLRVVTDVERKYAEVGQELIEQLYIQEVMDALDECLAHVANKNA
jgi:hypothetical protein